VFIPIGNNGWLISTDEEAWKGKKRADRAEYFHDFDLSTKRSKSEVRFWSPMAMINGAADAHAGASDFETEGLNRRGGEATTQYAPKPNGGASR
jgi:hypothetical protein